MPTEIGLTYRRICKTSPRKYHLLLPPPVVLVVPAPESVVLSFLGDADGADAASSSGSRSSPSSFCRSVAASRDPLFAVEAPPLPPKLPLKLLMDETPAALRQMAALMASTSRASLPAAFCTTKMTMKIIYYTYRT